MKYGILTLGFLALLCLAAAGGSWATSTAQEESESISPIPNLCEQASDSAKLVVRGTGHTKSAEHEASLIVSDAAGQCEVKWIEWRHSPATEFEVYWDGILLDSIAAPLVNDVNLIYTVIMYVRADGEIELAAGDPEQQMWWGGTEIGYYHPTTHDRFFSQGCIEASQDPAYLRLHKPGTGPACIAKIIVKD